MKSVVDCDVDFERSTKASRLSVGLANSFGLSLYFDSRLCIDHPP
jgi:hypothetical protein